ncbi:glycosyl hydrolase family 18 protein [Anaerovorax odorimutans]|uniref:glycosyl hydrolase family 18 protein n=1 Tax=Anaerovorax odorimutans TaxID=109327 RepID=UPI000427435B|nr:glycosyl hydrolase family 18 protein [Anaerovorax odorimutans]
MAVAPINKVREVLDYGVTQIPPEKILMGIPNYGYDWTLPFIQGESVAENISNVEAILRAERVGAEIKFDEVAQAPYYEYYDTEGRQHIVWFENDRSIRAKLDLVNEYGLAGVSYWSIMNYFPANSVILNSLYDISKVE